MWSRFTTPAELDDLEVGLADGTCRSWSERLRCSAAGLRFADLGSSCRRGSPVRRQAEGPAEADALRGRHPLVVRGPRSRARSSRRCPASRDEPHRDPATERLAVRTTLARLTEARARDAITSEIRRGGQTGSSTTGSSRSPRSPSSSGSGSPTARIAVAHARCRRRPRAGALDFVDRSTTCWSAPPSSRAASTCRT